MISSSERPQPMQTLPSSRQQLRTQGDASGSVGGGGCMRRSYEPAARSATRARHACDRRHSVRTGGPHPAIRPAGLPAFPPQTWRRVRRFPGRRPRCPSAASECKVPRRRFTLKGRRLRKTKNSLAKSAKEEKNFEGGGAAPRCEALSELILLVFLSALCVLSERILLFIRRRLAARARRGVT